jgi:hypothetical protein
MAVDGDGEGAAERRGEEVEERKAETEPKEKGIALTRCFVQPRS